MPKVAELARVTSRDGAVWRTCAGCGWLVAIAPELDRCDICRAETRPGELERGRS